MTETQEEKPKCDICEGNIGSTENMIHGRFIRGKRGELKFKANMYFCSKKCIRIFKLKE